MNREQLEKTVKNKLTKSFGILDENQIKDESNFNNDLGFDSLDVIELVMWTEREFQISLLYEDVEKISTFKQFIDYLVHLLGIH